MKPLICLIFLFACLGVCVADELSNRAAIQDAFDKFNELAPEPKDDPDLVPSVQKCMELNSRIPPAVCLDRIQKLNEIILAKYKRTYVTDYVVATLNQTPELKTIQTESKKF